MSENTLLEREGPRARLEAALEAARRGRGCVMSIEGEAGIGKTSLVLAFAEAHRHDARVHIGGCEHLATPEPLGPLRDIARESHGRFAISSIGQLSTFEALLRLLANGRGPALLVLEDIHWADAQTLDLVRYLGRRIRSSPILVVVTFRHEEAESQVSLASLWADMPRDARERVELAPLTLTAVSALARSAGRDADDVFEATGGNPFHVTEYLATPPPDVPRSVGDATLARAESLSPRGRRTLDCASIFPRQIDEATLRVLADDVDDAGVQECLHVGMLNARTGALAFRHELARRSILEAIPPLKRRELHAAALAVVKARRHGRAAEAAHHAEQAGAIEDLVEFSVLAGEEAEALGAHREAVAHFAKALAHGDAFLTDAERADFLERQADAGEQCGELDSAVTAIDRAIAIYRQAGDVRAVGNALRISARLVYLIGRPEETETRLAEALRVLESHQNTWQYAMALSSQSQIDYLSDRLELGVERGERAMVLAEQAGRSDIYLHALTNVATARSSIDAETGLPQLTDAIAEARRRREPDLLPRLYTCKCFVMASDRRYGGLFETIQEGIDAAVARDNAPMDAYTRSSGASALLDLGRLEEAVAQAEFVVHGPYPPGISRFPALIALSRARLRLGLPEGGAIDVARAMPTASRDLMRMAPVAIADAEASWLGHARESVLERLRATLAKALTVRGELWWLAEVAMWLTMLGEWPDIPPALFAGLAEPHRLHIAGRWREAADAWLAKGCPFEQGLALTMGEEADQREALAIFDRMRAVAAAQKLRRLMRERGVRQVPAGPRSARRNDPAGLTPRQNQVLALLAEGLSNVEIAERLNTSAKTVEHHVGAILAAFDATSRLRAVQIARQRGVFGPDVGSPGAI